MSLYAGGCLTKGHPLELVSILKEHLNKGYKTCRIIL